MNENAIVTQRIKSVAERHRLRLVVLYGSYAKGTATASSDIDIAVLGESLLSFEEMLSLQNEFSDLFPGREVDVKSLHRAVPFFRYHVMKDGKLLFGDRRLFTNFKVYAIRAHQENFKLRKLRDALIEKRQKHLASLFLHA
jgi:predicted nucleotidyltransferase